MLRRRDSKAPFPPEDGLQVEEFYDRFMKTSSSPESLRQLHYLLHGSPERELPEGVTIALVSTLCDQAIGSVLRDLCSLILQESLPNDALNLQDFEVLRDTIYSVGTLSQLLAVQTAGMTTSSEESKWVSTLLRHLTSEGIPFPLILRSIQAFAQTAISLPRNMLTKDKLEALCRLLSLHLKMGFSSFKTAAVHGISSELVTALSAHNVTDEYLLNVETFSSLRQAWDVLFSDTRESLPKSDLLMTIVDYCLFVMDQCERITQKNQEHSLQRTCLVEAVAILDLACTSDARLVIRVFPIIRRIHDQSNDLVLSIRALQFILNHSDQIAYVPSTELEQFFGERVCSELENNGTSYEAVVFLAYNLERFNDTSSSPLRVWFPNIIKLLAWFPMTFSAEFIVFIPTFLSMDTSVEVLHCILDLPCLTAALMTTMQEAQINPLVMQSLRTPNSKAMLNFVLRKCSGRGETLDKLSELHKLLQPFSSHPRVTMAAKIVIPLLESFFDVMNEFYDEHLATKLVPVIFERTNNLFSVTALGPDVHQLLSKEVLNVFRKYPKLVMLNKVEVMEFLSASGHLHHPMYNNLVWSVGQYASSNYCSELSPDIVRSYYDVLECIIYEHLGSFSPKTVCITVATMSKLSSRCQDLVPRVLLCLGKIDQFAQNAIESDWTAVSLRVEEFVAVLREPNVASVALSPLPENLLGRQHLDNTSLPALWRATNQMISS